MLLDIFINLIIDFVEIIDKPLEILTFCNPSARNGLIRINTGELPFLFLLDVRGIMLYLRTIAVKQRCMKRRA